MRQLFQPIAAFVYCNRQAAADRRAPDSLLCSPIMDTKTSLTDELRHVRLQA